MSTIGEAMGFGKMARDIERQLENPGLTPDERAALVKKLDWYELESRCAMSEANREAKMDRDYERAEFNRRLGGNDE